MAAAALSPSTSPRLPSPPPIPEDQVGPISPSSDPFDDASKFPGGVLDNGASRRIRPGTKSEDMAEGPPLVELTDLDSAFQLTEHVKALHYSYTHPADSNTTIPVTAEFARQLSRPPPNTSKDIWLYELGRFLIQKTNAIIVALFADQPPCSSLTCPEMRASEWQYLCAVHDPPKSCSAIDYCCHTLDWAAATLTSSKMFPSRLGLGSGAGTTAAAGGHDKVLNAQMKEIYNIFRRVYRIYAHAWFQHRDMFWRVEGKTGLYILFKTVCDEYGMIQPENYTIPPEAEGLEPELSPLAPEPPQSLSLLRRDQSDAGEERPATLESAGSHVAAAAVGDTTKRHRHTRSDVPSSLGVSIQEEVEEDEGAAEPSIPVLGRQPTVLKKPEEAVEEKVEEEKAGAEAEEEGEAGAEVPEAKQEDDHEVDAAEETVIEAEPESDVKPAEAAADAEDQKEETGVADASEKTEATPAHSEAESKPAAED